MINNPNPCTGLNEAVESQGEKLYEVDNVWRSTNDLVVQPIIDNFDCLAWFKAEAIAQIKEKASELITSRLPTWKQINIIAEAGLITAKPSRGAGNLTQFDKDAVDVLEGNYIYPMAVRMQSDIEEDNINAATDFTTIADILSNAKDILDSIP